MLNYNIFKTEDQLDKDFYKRYFIVSYDLESKTNLRDAAWNLAIGQSIGNPSARSEFETQDMIDNHCVLILADEKELLQKNKGNVKFAFPETNINFETDGISQLLVQIMGGQCDIDIIYRCFVTDLQLTENMTKILKGPKIGLKEIKQYCNISNDKPIFGGIVKPKIGLSPEKNLDLVKQMIDGGCNFIKEDEILSDPQHCPIHKRVPLVMNYLRNTGLKVFYAVSIHADPSQILKRVKQVYELGGNGVHINFHCGLGVYKSVRELDLPVLVHFQKSGDKILNCVDHRYGIDQNVIFKLVAQSGCSTLHAGMIGGYMDNETAEVKKTIRILNDANAVPALSCGMHPGLIDYIMNEVGHGNWMANVGGALSSHPMGTLAGAKAMRQSIDKNYGIEYQKAIDKWGKK